jgi:hypothetical protein
MIKKPGQRVCGCKTFAILKPAIYLNSVRGKMKIKLSQLRSLIREEISRTLSENFEFVLPEDPDVRDKVISDGLTSPYALYRELESIYNSSKQYPNFKEIFEDLLENWDPTLSGRFVAYTREKKKDASEADVLAVQLAEQLVYRVRDKRRLPFFGVEVNTLEDLVKVLKVNKEFGKETEQMRQNAAMAAKIYPRDARGRIIGRAD